MNSARLRTTIAVLGVLFAAPTLAATLTVYSRMGGAPFLAGDVNFPVGTVSAVTAGDTTVNCATSSTAGCVDTAVVTTTGLQLQAVNTTNSTFVGWSGCSSVAGNVCTLNYGTSTSKTVTATFAPAAYYLSVKTYPVPSGTWVPAYGGVVTATTPVIDCKTGDAAHAACLDLAANGATVTLTATPAAGSKVGSWSGCTPGAGDTCAVSMATSKAVSATFVSAYVPVTVQKVGSGTVTATGTVAADPLSCGTDCVGGADLNATVTLTATPASGSKFLGWSGACTGTAACALTMSAAKSVTATFKVASCTGCHAMAPATHAASLTACGDCHAGYTSDSVNSTTHANGVVDSTRVTTKHTVLNDTTLAGITSGATDGPKVTAICLTCHRTQGAAVLGSNHFTWMGNSAMTGQTQVGKRNLINNFCVAVASNEARCNQCHPSYSTAPVKDPTTGAAQVNTGSMYNWATNPAADKTKIDCLICHTNIGVSNYVKSPANFGQPWPKNPGCIPSCSAIQICSPTDSAGVAWGDGKSYCRAPTAAEQLAPLKNGAKNLLAAPARSNCGFCHFNAGGGDNVKMGDLGSALAAPTAAVDFHMGSTASGGKGLGCVACHNSAASHKVAGAGLSIPVDDEGRVACTDCHAAGPHVNGTYNTHAGFIACQTCHIPRFSKTQYTKMNWDWRTSGDKQACQGLAGCVGFGTVVYPAGNAQSGTVGGVGGEADKAQNHVADPADPTHGIAMGYDWKKGVSRYEQNVVPTYRWFNGAGSLSGTHTTTDASNIGTKGDTAANPATLSGPTAGMTFATGKKIFPFKRMTGRSPAFADGSAMLVPHVFGSDSLWQNSLLGAPVVPNTLGSVANPWTEAKLDAIWDGVLNIGAAAGGQLGAAVAKAPVGAMVRDEAGTVTVTSSIPVTFAAGAQVFLVGAEATFPSGVKTITNVAGNVFTYTETLGTNPAAGTTKASTAFVSFVPKLPAWKWVYTEMFINLNHEVAPRASALNCTNCHGAAPEANPMRELYGLTTGGCTDPASCKIVNP